MKIFSPVGIAVSLTASVLLHALVSLFFVVPEENEMLEGGVQGDVAVIGTSFADMVSRENMIARSEPDENTPVKPDPAEVQEEIVPAEQVSDADTVKPVNALPSKNVQAKAAVVAAARPVAEPPTQMAAVSPLSDSARKPAEVGEVQKSSQMAPAQPTPAHASMVPSAQRPIQSISASTPLSSKTEPAASKLKQAPAQALSTTDEVPDVVAAPVETPAALANAEPVPDIVDKVQKPASSEPQTAMKVESLVKASTATVTGRSTPMQSVKALSEQAVPMADVQPAPEEPETTQAAPAQIASLQPVTATEAADASDVTPAAEPGIPAPRVRPPQPNDGKIVASSTRRKAEKPAPQKKRAVAQKQRSAAKRKQSSTQRSAQNNSGKSSHNASRGGGSGSKKKAAGNAKASNYPGLVYRKIQKTRQKRAGGRGSVRIRFSVSSSGGLARISIAKSSGSKKIDQAALAHIRRAAPFPAPPKGARRSFTIPVDIRG